MSSAPVAALVATLTLAGVLATSGVAKARDRQATRDAFTALRVPRVVPADLAAGALPWAELVLAVLLLLAPTGWLVPVAAAALVLMLTYTALVVRALGFDQPVRCSCFGSIGRHDVDRTTAARNVLLSAVAAVVLWSALAGGSVPSAVSDLDAEGWWTLVASAAAAVVAALVVGGPRAEEASPDVELLDYERQAIPFGALTLADGTATTLVELGRSQARLVVVLNPGCGPCVRTAEKLDGWATRLAPAVGVVAVYPDHESASAQTEHAPALAAWEPELNVRRVFSVGTPGAVLLGADGLMAGGPVAGERHIEEFVQDVIVELTGEPAPDDTVGS
ncbi:thioredoxin family protein [Nocardioides sp. J2M5]|uniref:TlpA family protein disulfide reductase n=1 Tax=Nocardioides palaemonis TaxID=2829810 RepID=UPI001BAC5041|nr:thioredoxin family protein [Nocardioides palaemonis]MBS2936460.1 thioredoxin family protein [Nocardioides palaemonis]